MLRGVIVGEGDRLVEGARPQHRALRRERGRADGRARLRGQEPRERLDDGLGEALARRDRHHGRQWIVLRLREQLARHELRVGGVVGEHQQFTRASRGIDRHGARHLKLRLRHVCVAWSHDAIDARHACGAVRHGRHGARAAEGEHAIRAGEGGGGEHHRRGRARGALRRRAEDDLTHAGHPRWHDPHQHAARICGAAAGRVYAHPLQRIRTTTHDDAGLALRFLCHRMEGAVHALHVGGGAFHGAPECGVERIERAGAGAPRHLECVERHTIELPRQATERGVAVAAHASDDVRGA